MFKLELETEDNIFTIMQNKYKDFGLDTWDKKRWIGTTNVFTATTGGEYTITYTGTNIPLILRG